MAAAQSVFALPELVEMIFLAPIAFTVDDLMRYSRVCTTWYDVIAKSKRIQQRMHRAPIKPCNEPPTACDTLPSFVQSLSFDDTGFTNADGGLNYYIKAQIDIDAVHSINVEPLRQVLLLQPAYKLEYLHLTNYACDEDESQRDSWCDYECELFSDVAATLSVLPEAAERAIRKHNEECAPRNCGFPKGGKLYVSALAQPVGHIAEVKMGMSFTEAFDRDQVEEWHHCNECQGTRWKGR